MRKPITLALMGISLVCALCAQDAVPAEILNRTLLIKNANKSGTGFVIEHKGTAYLVTARHMVEGLPVTKATIEVWRDNTWNTLQTVRILFPQSTDVDIAVLKLDERVAKPYDITTDDAGGSVMLGQQVWFLGYPYGLGTQFEMGSKLGAGGAPFIKRGTMSAIDAHNPNAVVMYIDGFNNPGFSGGPIVYWDFSLRKCKIIGVVQGYKAESAKVVVNGQQMDTQFLVNSSILIAYDVSHVNKAIEAEDRSQP